MCLTALKNSLVLGNCQPIISTPSSGLSQALRLALSLCLCAHLSASLSLYLIFSPNSPSKLSFSITHPYSFSNLCIFIFTHSLFLDSSLTLKSPTPPSCPQKAPVMQQCTCFSQLFTHSVPARLLHPVKQHQMPLIRS